MTRKEKIRLIGNAEKKCYYCGISEEESSDFFNKNPECTRGFKRGIHLEISRIDTRKDFEQGNVVWACFPCNNSKSNYCNSVMEFKPISNGIKQFWIERGYSPK